MCYFIAVHEFKLELSSRNTQIWAKSLIFQPMWPWNLMDDQTVTPVWIHRWLRNDAQSLKWHRRSAIFFFEVIIKSLGNIGWKIDNFDRNWLYFWTVTPVWIHRWLRKNDAQNLKLHRRGALLIFRVIHQILGSQAQKSMIWIWYGQDY